MDSRNCQWCYLRLLLTARTFKAVGVMTTPLSTAGMQVERNTETITKKAHSFISTVLGEELLDLSK